MLSGFDAWLTARCGRRHETGDSAEQALNGGAILEGGHAAHRNGLFCLQFLQRETNIGQRNPRAFCNIRVEQLAVLFQVGEDGFGVHDENLFEKCQ